MLAPVIGKVSSVFKNAGSEGLDGPKMLHSASTVLARRKEAKDQQMGQKPAKDRSGALGKSVSHRVAAEVIRQHRLKSGCLLPGTAQADAQSTSLIRPQAKIL